MKILILEDDENRVKKFKQNFIGCELFITHLTKQAIEWIGKEEFDYIFLDHDLEESHYLTWQDPSISHENTGLDVAKFLGENPELNQKAVVFIHSLNPCGSENMSKACSDRNPHKIPFTTLFGRLIINR